MGDRFARPLLDFHAELLRAGADAGVFRPVDPTLFFFSLVGACEFLFAGRSWLEEAAGERIESG